MLAGSPFTFLLSICGLSGTHPSHIYFAGYRILVCLFVGPMISWYLGHKMPWLVATGRWIWMLPVVVMFPEMIREELGDQRVPYLPEYFFATAGEGSFGVDLFSLPTFCALGYSIGMAVVGMGTKWWPKSDSLHPGRHIVAFALAWIVLFSALASLAHQFEYSKIERWSRVRSLIDDLWLSPDASLVCTGPASRNGIQLTGAIMVEGLERRACGKDKLLDADGPRPAGAWMVERIKVLTGAKAGVEGWVLAYGLRGTMEP